MSSFIDNLELLGLSLPLERGCILEGYRWNNELRLEPAARPVLREWRVARDDSANDWSFVRSRRDGHVARLASSRASLRLVV